MGVNWTRLDVRSRETTPFMRARHLGQGCLMRLRRYAALGLVAICLVFAVGVMRAEALAFAAGDEFCIAMGGTLPVRAASTDPLDLGDPSHACCDLGLCLVATAAPPLAAPSIAVVARAVVRLRPTALPRLAVRETRPHHPRSRGPPTL